MRALTDRARLFELMRRLGADADAETRIYLTGGATAVVEGWRDSTIDVDIKIVPDRDSVLRAIPRLKEILQINVELASPDDFIPVRDGWQDRSPFVAREGRVTFHHFEFAAQALAKIERGHVQDLRDTKVMLERGLVTAAGLKEYFDAIEPRLYRYPAVDAASFRQAVADFIASAARPS